MPKSRPISQSLPLNRKRILGYEAYRRLDPETFDFVSSGYKGRSSRIARKSKLIQDAFPTLDKVYWRPDRRLFERRPTDPQHAIQVSEFLHEGVHQLFYDRFGDRCFFDPTLALMAEATATAIDIHFWLLVASNQKWRAQRFAKFYNINIKPGTDESASIDKHIQCFDCHEARVDVFNRHQAVMAGYFYELNALFDSNLRGLNLSIKSLERFMQSTDMKWFAYKFDFANFILFVHAYGDRPFDKIAYQKRILNAENVGTVAAALKGILA